MQRISLLLAGFAPAVLWGQQGAGTELWRVAATTLPVPPALATGGAAAFWNPAQPTTPERVSLALDVIETAPTVNASGVLVTVRARVRPLGRLIGVAVGRHDELVLVYMARREVWLQSPKRILARGHGLCARRANRC